MNEETIPESGPIFVTGTTRSGKSLLSKLLGLHPNIATHDMELRVWRRYYNRYGDLSQRANFERCFDAMLSHKNIRSLINNDSECIRRKFWDGAPSYERLFALLFECYAERLGKSRWSDQSQHIGHYALTILANYPAAEIIYMVRDPRDRIASKGIARQRQGAKNDFMNLYRDVSKWRRSVRLAAQNQKQYPERYKIVRYETLVSQPQETLHDVCTFLGESDIPTPLLEKGLRGFQDDAGNSKYDSVSTAYIGRFRETRSKREIAFIQARTRQAMAACGYDLEPVQLLFRDYVLLYFIDWPISLIRECKDLLMEALRP